jgi:outer membrane lipoprotein SlyB
MPKPRDAHIVSRRMIRRLISAAAVLVLAGCAVVEHGGGRVTYSAVPLVGQTYDRDIYNREGTSFYNPRWSFDPDSHPAVRPPASGAASASPYPPVSARSAAEQRAEGQVSGAIVGALLGAQAGNRTAGIIAGSATGAFMGGKVADPCSPGPNLGTAWGALVGGWFGSLFGGGRGRDFWTAVGAAGGAVRGTEMGADGRRCR